MTDIKKISEQYGTPFFLYDFNHIEKQYVKFAQAVNKRKSLICFAVKANSNLSVLSHLSKLGAGADCVSIGEVQRALLANIPNNKIIFSGVGKSDYEIKKALELDIFMINVESKAELDRIEVIAQALNKKAQISIRVNPNIDPKTHPYISTGLEENKFGVNLDIAEEIYIQSKSSKYLDPIGIHFHIGSQLTKLLPIKETVIIVSSFVKKLQRLDIQLKYFNVGGGVGISYYKDEKTISINDYSDAIFKSIDKLDMTLICEPGRYIVGNSGIFVTKVLYEKYNNEKRFIIVDGAMNDLMRPTLYTAYHHIEVFNNTNSEFSDADVVGSVCESSDFFAKDRPLPKTNHNDLIIIKSAGAYGFGMGSNYNSRGRAVELALENGKTRIIRKRENFENLVSLEKEFLIE